MAINMIEQSTRGGYLAGFKQLGSVGRMDKVIDMIADVMKQEELYFNDLYEKQIGPDIVAPKSI